MNKHLKLTALTLGLFAASQAIAADLTVVAFGGGQQGSPGQGVLRAVGKGRQRQDHPRRLQR